MSARGFYQDATIYIVNKERIERGTIVTCTLEHTYCCIQQCPLVV